MRIILSESNDFLFGADIDLCSSMKEVYQVADREAGDSVMLVYIDVELTNIPLLKELEMFRYEFDTFKIILDRSQSILLKLSNELELECYSLTSTTKTGSDLFLNSEGYLDAEEGLDLEELSQGFNSKAVVQNMVQYDFPTFNTMVNSLLNSVRILGEEYSKVKTDLSKHIKDKSVAVENLRIANSRLLEVENSREYLLSENLRLKFDGYLKSLERSPVEVNTPTMYVKSILAQEEETVLEFFKILNRILLNKYNLNSCLVVIEDENKLKLKKIMRDFTYVSAGGKYNMNMGNQIITTGDYVESLFEHFNSFSGVKDIFIVLDFTLTTRTYAVGEGVYLSIENDRKNPLYKTDSEDIEYIQENEIKDISVGGDEFNKELNITQSKLFKRVEGMIMSVI